MVQRFPASQGLPAGDSARANGSLDRSCEDNSRAIYREVTVKDTRTLDDLRLISIRKKAKERKDRRVVTGYFVPFFCVQCILQAC